METKNIYTAEGEPLPGEGEHKFILSSGDRVRCLYYKRPPSPDKDIMEGAHSHPAESVRFVISGEVEYSVNGERVTLKQGDAMLKPYDAIVGSKVISTTPAEILIVTSPNSLRETPKST